MDFVPEPFDIVELALVGRKDVNDDVAEIDQNPGTVVVTLDSRGFETVLLRSLDDTVGDGARLNLRTAGEDGERVGEDRTVSYVDLDEIFGFLFFGGVAYDVDQISDGVLPSVVRNAWRAANVFGATAVPERSR